MAKSVLDTIGSIMEVAQPLSQGEINFKKLNEPLPPNKKIVPGITDQDHIFNGIQKDANATLPASYKDDQDKAAYDKTLKVSENPYPKKEEVEASEENTVFEKVEDSVEETPVLENAESVEEAMKGEDEYYARYGKGGKKKPALDAVGKEDSDVNNDGKVDSSDSYLKNRRKVINKYLNKEETHPVVLKKEEQVIEKTTWKEMLKKKVEEEASIEEEIISIDESLKLLKTYKVGDHTAKVYKDHDWDEHRVKFFTGDKHHKDADYHSDDADDAHDTAKTQLRDMAKKAMKEEAQQIHELSKGTLKSYVKKALDTGSEKSISNLASRGGYETGKSADDDFESGYKHDRKSVVRSQGVQRAVNKLAKEELDVIGEKHLTAAEMKKREEIAKAIAKKNPDMPMGKKMAIATATAKKVAEEVEDLDEAQFSRDQLKSAMDALENTKKAAAKEKDMKKRTNHLMRQNFLTKQVSYMRSAIASEGSKNLKMAEAVDVDVNMHEFMANKAQRAIAILKKNNKPVPDELLRTYEKHRQEINKYRKDVGKPMKEGVDFATARSDRGAIKTYVKYGKNGQTELVSRRAPRAEIKIGEEAEQVDESSYSAKAARAGKDIGEKGKNFAAIAKDAAKRYGSKKSGENVAGAVLAKIRAKHMKEAMTNDDMMQASVDKLRNDPLASKMKIKLPPSQGLKPIGGDEQAHANMAEEKLNRLYESLSYKNKVKFMEKLETEEGFEQLIRFAEEQGF